MGREMVDTALMKANEYVEKARTVVSYLDIIPNTIIAEGEKVDKAKTETCKPWLLGGSKRDLLKILIQAGKEAGNNLLGDIIDAALPDLTEELKKAGIFESPMNLVKMAIEMDGEASTFDDSAKEGFMDSMAKIAGVGPTCINITGFKDITGEDGKMHLEVDYDIIYKTAEQAQALIAPLDANAAKDLSEVGFVGVKVLQQARFELVTLTQDVKAYVMGIKDEVLGYIARGKAIAMTVKNMVDKLMAQGKQLYTSFGNQEAAWTNTAKDFGVPDTCQKYVVDVQTALYAATPPVEVPGTGAAASSSDTPVAASAASTVLDYDPRDLQSLYLTHVGDALHRFVGVLNDQLKGRPVSLKPATHTQLVVRDLSDFEDTTLLGHEVRFLMHANFCLSVMSSFGAVGRT